MAKALIVYASRTGTTKRIAGVIAEGIRDAGVEVDLVDVKDVANESKLQGYDGYAFGSATYHGEMMQPMKTMLFLAEKAQVEGKIGGAFGAYGWSGEAPERIYDTMKNIFSMDMVGTSLKLKSPGLTPVVLKAAHDYGTEIARRITAKG
ncbi:MAG: FprA family A-type flavoprotein [Deltaproteobacteria bacterium]|nr:FprA family A-type flavoprotein [Deltaproteobacteria bacterium]